MATKKPQTATETPENEKAVNSTTEAEKGQETANTNAVEGRFIYVGPTTKGLVENTIFVGTREDVEKSLKDTIDKIPQVKMLIITTESLAENRAKIKTTGTLLNKYYHDVLSLSKKE